MSKREDELVRRLRRSTYDEVQEDARRICRAVNFDGLTTSESEALWLVFFAGHGWSQGGIDDERDRRRQNQG